MVTHCMSKKGYIQQPATCKICRKVINMYHFRFVSCTSFVTGILFNSTIVKNVASVKTNYHYCRAGSEMFAQKCLTTKFF